LRGSHRRSDSGLRRRRGRETRPGKQHGAESRGRRRRNGRGLRQCGGHRGGHRCNDGGLRRSGDRRRHRGRKLRRCCCRLRCAGGRQRRRRSRQRRAGWSARGQAFHRQSVNGSRRWRDRGRSCEHGGRGRGCGLRNRRCRGRRSRRRSSGWRGARPEARGSAAQQRKRQRRRQATATMRRSTPARRAAGQRGRGGVFSSHGVQRKRARHLAARDARPRARRRALGGLLVDELHDRQSLGKEGREQKARLAFVRQ
jgi:hypothetical protein